MVSRVSAEEDAEFKYDFKIRVKHRVRGVRVESKNIRSLGFQLKTYIEWESVRSKEYPKGKRGLVDEIIELDVPSREFRDVIRRWLEAGEPSGGPEQFLSPELKKAILKAVTEKLIDVPQEVFDKIK